MLLPMHYNSCNKWEFVFKETSHGKIEIKFGSKTCQICACAVVTTPYYGETSNAMDESNILHGFRNDNFGSIIESDETKNLHLTTCGELSLGRDI